MRERGLAEVFGGSLQDADWLLGEAEGLSERLGDRRGMAWVRQHQAWVAFLSGDTELAERRLLTAAQEFDLLGDGAGLGWASGLLAYVRFYQGRFEEAEALATKVRTESAALGDPWAPAMMDSLVASIRLWTTRFSEAEELSRRALHAFRQIGDRFGTVQALGPRLRALVALGRGQEAERGMEEVMAISESFGDLSFPAMTAAGAAVHMGLGERAVVIAELALERGLAMGSEVSESRVTLALALCQARRPDDALGYLHEVDRTSAYAASVSALALAMVGDASGAIESAALIDEASSTYLDRVVANIAAAAGEIMSGEPDAARERLVRADVTAREAGDVVARSLVTAASQALIEQTEIEAGHLGPGWRRAISALAAVALQPQDDAAVEPA